MGTVAVKNMSMVMNIVHLTDVRRDAMGCIVVKRDDDEYIDLTQNTSHADNHGNRYVVVKRRVASEHYLWCYRRMSLDYLAELPGDVDGVDDSDDDEDDLTEDI